MAQISLNRFEAHYNNWEAISGLIGGNWNKWNVESPGGTFVMVRNGN